MNPSSIHTQLQATGQFGTGKTGYLNEVAKNLEQKSYNKAFDVLVFFFLGLNSQESDDVVKRAYDYLCACLPHLEATGIRSLYDKIFPSLDLFPNLTRQQLDLALALASWYDRQPITNEETLYQNIVQAMHYYAKTRAVGKIHHPDRLTFVHHLASKPFMRIIRIEMLENKKFQTCLELAKRKNDKILFKKILDNIELFKKYCCDDEDDAIIKGLYEQARQVFLETHLDKGFNEEFIPEIQKALTEPHLAADIYITQKYENALESFRASSEQRFTKIFSSKSPDPTDVRLFQQGVTHSFLFFFRDTFLEDAFAIIGPAPCGYDLRFMGSVAREEICRYSDIEWMILIEDDKHLDYYKKLVRIIELQIIFLGETAATDLPVFNCISQKNRSGLHIDTGGHPIHANLIKTPKEMAQLQRSIEGVEDDPCQPHHSLRKTLSFHTNDPRLEAAYCKEISLVLPESGAKARALALLKTRLQSYKHEFAQPFEQLATVDLKKGFVELIYYALHDMALYYGLKTLNTLDLIDELVKQNVFTKQSGVLLKQVIGH